MWLLNTWESLQSAFPYFGFNSFFWVRKRKEKSRSATFQQGRSYSAAPIHGRGPLGATESQTPRWKLAVGHWDVSSATGGCLNIWEPQVLVEIACDSFLKKISGQSLCPGENLWCCRMWWQGHWAPSIHRRSLKTEELRLINSTAPGWEGHWKAGWC